MQIKLAALGGVLLCAFGHTAMAQERAATVDAHSRQSLGKAAEIKVLFNNTLDTTRTAALWEKMLRACLPI